MKTTEQKVRAALRRHLRRLEDAKRSYAAADRALARALHLGLVPGEPFRLNAGGEVYAIVDHCTTLRNKGAIYRPARLARYSVEEVKQKEIKP